MGALRIAVRALRSLALAALLAAGGAARRSRTGCTSTTGTITSPRTRWSASRQACRCRLVQDYYSDNEEMLAKLAAGAAGYDILVPTGNAVATLIRQGALRPLDRARLPNLANLKPEFLDLWFDPGNRYSVPYAYSVTLLGYNDEKMRELGIPTDTWAAIFEPKYLERLHGKVTVLDSQRELMAAALIYLGYPANDTDPAHWQAGARPDPARQALLGGVQRRELHQGAHRRQHLARARLFERHAHRAPGRAQGGAQVHDRLLDAEGGRGVRGRQPGACTRAGARPDLAYQFINFLLEGRELRRALERDRRRQPERRGDAR